MGCTRLMEGSFPTFAFSPAPLSRIQKVKIDFIEALNQLFEGRT